MSSNGKAELQLLTKTIEEGQAKILAPSNVFYNPVQQFNRDLSVLVINTYLKHKLYGEKNLRIAKESGGFRILDALSATGLRSIRYAKELDPTNIETIDKIVANDLSEKAIEIIKRNISENHVSDKVRASHDDASLLMHDTKRSASQRFHVIDLDPFGSAAKFLDAAVSSIESSGLLMVTCTDTAVLCGNASESCFARYGSMSLRTPYCHEMGLRILLRSLEQHASRYGRFIKPLVSLSIDFYMRLFVQVFTQPAETKMAASRLAQVYHCKACHSFELLRLGKCTIKEDAPMAASNNLAVKYKFQPPDALVSSKCGMCGRTYSIGGPIWAEPMHDKTFVNQLINELGSTESNQQPNKFGTHRRLDGMLHIISEELDVPLYYETDKLTSVINMPAPPQKLFNSALLNAGYQVSATHASPGSFKTTAPGHIVWDIMCQWARENPRQKKAKIQSDGEEKAPMKRTDMKTTAGESIMDKMTSKDDKKTYDFTFHRSAEPISKKLQLLRFQTNPTANWGPKKRPRDE
ncbi:putative tRNA (guanine(26)-N(2))-dimethyltransferase, partial [Fragariocoptes setiger]